MNPVISKMKIPDFSGPSYKRKPWIPPPALTSKENGGDSTKLVRAHRAASRPFDHAASTVIHSAASSVEHPRGTAIPLLHYEDTTWPLTLPSSASLSGIALPLAGCSLTSRAGQHSERLLRDSSTWTELKCRATETQTDCNGKDAKMEQLKQEVAGLRGALEVEKLTQVVSHLDAEYQGFSEALQERQGALDEARERLEAMHKHLGALKATLAIAKDSVQASIQGKHHEQVLHYTTSLKEKAAELRNVIASIGHGDDTALGFASGTIPRIWEQLTKLLSRTEEERLTSSHDELVKHLHERLKEKEEQMFQAERDLNYYKKREEQEKERHDRCLDTIEEMQRRQREDRDALRKSSKASIRKVTKLERSLKNTQLVLNQREKELAAVTRERDELRVMLDKMALDKIDMDRALATVKRKLVDLEPAILNNPAGPTEDKSLRLILEKYKRELEKQQAVSSHSTGTLGLSSRLQTLKNELKKSRDPMARQLAAIAEQLDKDIRNLGSSGADASLTEHERSAPHGSGRPPCDCESEQLASKVTELQDRLDRMTASNRNLTSYIATLRRSYAAVFRETPESSLRHSPVEDSGANLASPQGS